MIPCCETNETVALATPSSSVASQANPIALSRQVSESPAPAVLMGEVVLNYAADSELPMRDENFVVLEYTTKSATRKRIPAELAAGLEVTLGDRVLFVTPANATTAVITSVLAPARSSTCLPSPTASFMQTYRSASQEMVLRDEESLRVTTSSGQTLVAIERGATGPIIRLGEGSLELDMPGELHLMADSLRFTTRSGPLHIESQTDDVIVQGRKIRLN